MRVAVVHVGVRSNRCEQLRAVLGEDQVAGPVAAAAQASAARQLSQVLHRPAGFQVAILIGEADNLVRVANVDPLGCRSGANAEVCWALPSGPTPRNTFIFPVSLSARKISPLGAVRSNRGLSRPVA